MNLLSLRESFDCIWEQLGNAETSYSEAALLSASHWKLGQDARLREDPRFRQTPWGLWMRAEDLLANDALRREFHSQHRGQMDLKLSLRMVEELFGRRCVFCPGDTRFVLEGKNVRLAASELSSQPIIVYDVGDLEKYTTHLPIHSLKAAAASDPAGEWGPRAQEQMIETVGWVRVSSRRRLNSRMFVAQLEGHSMDDGRSGLVDGGYAIFELWPSGTKQLSNVLVRGSFRDPETGSYAVKKYVADQRDEEGRHRQIALVSLNPDKERYPDIELHVEDEEALTVVAKVVQALSAEDYARRPKPLRHKGRRDLNSDQSLQRVHERLSKRSARFFEAVEQDVCMKPDVSAWNSQVVCLDVGSGGLHLEVGPLFGLWNFVKLLVARAGSGRTRQTLASNARLRPVHVAVLPSEGAWAWEADGFEDDPDVDLSVLDVSSLPSGRVSAFRVGADGVGRYLAGNRLSPGQTYRLLVPPEKWKSLDCCSITMTVLADGWRFTEVALPVEPTPELAEGLERLGLGLGQPTPLLSFGLASWPDEWRYTPRGEGFAAFGSDEDGEALVLVSIDGYDAEVDGEAQLFVHGPGGPCRVSLPAGSASTVELSRLAVGQYFCTLLHQRTRIQPAELPFEVTGKLEEPPPALLSATVASESTLSAPNILTRAWRGDLGLLKQEEFFLSGPPGWGTRLFWRELRDDYIATVELEPAGEVDTAHFLSLTRGRRERRLLGDLVLDFAELGSLALEHERHPTVESIGLSLGEMARKKGDLLRQRAGAFTQLLPIWFVPVGRFLGYEVEPVTGLPVEPPVHAAAARLLVTERRADGIGRRCKRVLVMLEELQPKLGEGLLEWIDGVCMQFGVDNALISTGLFWAEHRRRSRLPLKIWDLDEVLEEEELLIAFLRDVAEGV